MQQQQQQQPPPMMPSFPQSNITTEQIQKYLDDNKKLILAIMDNQNLGKLVDCAHYQALLQKNLMYLAAIADAQPQGPMIPSQMAPHPMMQPGGFYMQQPQAAAAVPQQQQQPVLTPKGPLQFNTPHSMQDLQQQKILQHHVQGGLPGPSGGLPGPSGTRSVAPNNSTNPIHMEASRGGGDGGLLTEAKTPSKARGGGSKQDANEGSRVPSASGARSSATGKGSGDAEAK
ncbi:GRF1-interacting factor 2 [Daucus carota subsp. sativus]|uniref:GRF1-interacting factor 2 n=1 Tax=Daucus carota subsp. sativus TaxID=79200 RepID=UPI0007EFEEE0|nr:PREDICTED: GRF1-interacting factor 2 [Daucus carota subsp. sativus]